MTAPKNTLQKISLAYGRSELVFSLPGSIQVDFFQPPDVPACADPQKAVWNAIHSPLAPQTRLAGIKGKIAIAINDKTRPVPHRHLLPPLLTYLNEQGVKREDITFIIATGTHQPMPPEDFQLILPPEIIQAYRVISHNCDDRNKLIDLGFSSMGTPILVNCDYYESDVRIVVGNIEPHHFMGFSGGVKSASIGLTSRETITANHAHLVKPEAHTGNYDSNPCRIDVEEIGTRIGVNFALNAILNTRKEIVNILWGDPKAVMQHGMKLSKKITGVSIPHLYDHVIVSAGGYPKDINFYQAQKALTNAAAITRDGGCVYLVAECEEGHGSKPFFNYMEDVNTPEEAMHKFSQIGFQVGPHKAFQVARIASRVNCYLVSGLDAVTVKKMLMSPLSIQDLEAYYSALPHGDTVAIMPYGVATIPLIAGE